MSFDLLLRALNELEVAFASCGSKLILGGGFGLFLWQSKAMSESQRTLISKDAWCEARATADLDVFLETEILADLGTIQMLRLELDQLNYSVITGVEHLHFEKYFSDTERVEINFLTGPITDPELMEKIKINRPRVRPKGNVEFHAYLTDEALGLSWSLMPIKMIGLEKRTNLFLPHAVTFLLMKLHAFKDRKEKGDNEKAGHHALDVYRVLCLMEEKNFEETKKYLEGNNREPVVVSGKKIVTSDFGSLNGVGFTKIREHLLYRDEFDLETMRSVLLELFSE